MSHVGELCSSDIFPKKYQLTEPALQQLAVLIRGADTAHLDLAPLASGQLAVSLGLSHLFRDNHEMLRHGMVMYDARYAWRCDCQKEIQGWPTKN